MDDVFSETGILTCSVYHGSILGPLLFLIYVNDLPRSLSESGSDFYADDTCIFYQDKDVHKIVDVLNKEFSTLKLSIHFWIKQNELKIKQNVLSFLKLNVWQS